MKSLVSRLRPASLWRTLVLVNGLVVGCAGDGSHRRAPSMLSGYTPSQIVGLPVTPPQGDEIRAISATAQPNAPPPNPPPQVLPFQGLNELSADALVEQVLARNLSLAQMAAAWQAALARYPQVTSLEDPMFGTTLAPGSIG